MLDVIREHGGRLGHFHLADTNGGLYGTGNLDFAAVLGALDDGAATTGMSRSRSTGRRHGTLAARSAVESLRGIGAVGGALVRRDPR